ncbi:hypothetical protein [Acidocella sp.]|uniref:hypothetical protein n=1 Tax=Acidocella sp. TaxID=50710 RepID=UPI00260D7AC6|nr:hypothetical protein [Acidocella sp.]
MTRILVLGAMAALGLSGCASAPPSPADQAEAAACTSQADAAYQQRTMNLQARPLQNGLRYGAPTQLFEGEQMGAMNARDNQIATCEQTGNDNGQPVVNGVPVVTPHIVGN